jgi:hypothetical protein
MLHKKVSAAVEGLVMTPYNFSRLSVGISRRTKLNNKRTLHIPLFSSAALTKQKKKETNRAALQQAKAITQRQLFATKHTVYGASQHWVFFYHKILDGFQHLLCLFVAEVSLAFQPFC